MTISHQQNGSKGVFYFEDNEIRKAQMTYSMAGPDKLIIDHTEVDASLKGQGVGYALVYAALDFARTNGIKIIPLCPFAKAVFNKRDDIKDVLI